MNSLSSLFVVIAFLLHFACFGQTGSALQTISGDQVLFKKNDTTQGNPYLFDDWSLATISDNDGNIIDNNQINYDCIKQAFLVKVEDKYIKLNKYKYNLVKVDTKDGQKDFINVVYDKNVFFAEALYRSDNIALLKKHEGKKNFSNRSSYNSVNSRYTISKKSKYFIKLDDKIYPTSKKEKDILKILSNKNLKSFIKDNKIKLKKDKDLIKLVKHFDSLQ